MFNEIIHILDDMHAFQYQNKALNIEIGVLDLNILPSMYDFLFHLVY